MFRSILVLYSHIDLPPEVHVSVPIRSCIKFGGREINASLSTTNIREYGHGKPSLPVSDVNLIVSVFFYPPYSSAGGFKIFY